MTPDEKLLVCLYKDALSRDDLFGPMGFLKVAYQAGHKEIQARKCVDFFAQTNFVIKLDGDRIRLTERGTKLAIKLLEKK